MSYLARLAVELSLGSARIPPETKSRHRQFVLACRNPDGGFVNRERESDVYYSSFALRSLMLVGGIEESVANPLHGFLKARLAGSPAPIDFLSLVFCDLILQTAGAQSVFDSPESRHEAFEAVIGPLARQDGSYAKTAKSKYGSLYNTFLIIACMELLGIEPAVPDVTRDFVRSRLREDGGFAEAAQMRAGGVNPTGAAVALLEILDDRDPAIRETAAGFLRAMRTPEGGFKAAGRIPFPDLLSTFTGLVALRRLTTADSTDRAPFRRFAESLECPGGGFRAGTWDETPDVEYTFYGLGTLALA